MKMDDQEEKKIQDIETDIPKDAMVLIEGLKKIVKNPNFKTKDRNQALAGIVDVYMKHRNLIKGEGTLTRAAALANENFARTGIYLFKFFDGCPTPARHQLTDAQFARKAIPAIRYYPTYFTGGTPPSEDDTDSSDNDNEDTNNEVTNDPDDDAKQQ